LAVPHFAEPLLPLLAPYTETVIMLGYAAGCIGSAARYAGLLAHTLGQLDDAVVYFEKALATNERIGALPQLAHTQHELARTLRAGGPGAVRARAPPLGATAAATAPRPGLAAPQQRMAAAGAAPRTAVTVPLAPSAGPARRTARLRHEGDVWSVACEEE